MRKLSVTTFLFLSSGAALAHPGHGAPSVHGHPSEWIWPVLGLAVAGLIAWRFRK
jgi:hypothetical protein